MGLGLGETCEGIETVVEQIHIEILMIVTVPRVQ